MICYNNNNNFSLKKKIKNFKKHKIGAPTKNKYSKVQITLI